MIAIGIVSKILFESAEIQIFRLTSGKHNFRVVSKLLSIAKGEAVAVTGLRERSEKYGVQIIASDIKFVGLTASLIREFLKSGTGIGDSIANRLIATLGGKLKTALEENDIETLTSVDRVTDAIAIHLCNAWHKNYGKLALINMLDECLIGQSEQNRDLVQKSSMQAYKIYGADTADKLTEDPYRLWAFSS